MTLQLPLLMPSPTKLVETEYFPLSTSRTDDDLRKVDVLIRAAKKPSRTITPTRLGICPFVLRTVAFVLIEFGFVILASFAMMKPIPIHLSSNITLTEAKGALTIISVLWHALAVLIAKDILLHMFSTEWIEQYRRSGSIVLGETDSVSRLTAGFLDHFKHFLSKSATLPFRLAFLSSLLLMLLSGLGPSTITINTVPHDFQLKVKVANLTLTENLSANGPNLLSVDRADLITRLEQVETADYGFRSQDTNTLIPWPSTDSMPINTTIRYQSDIIKYNFSCSWKQPTLNNGSGWTVDGKEWFVHLSPTLLNVELSDAAVLPMEMSGEIDGPANSSLIPFIFVGSNTTLSKHVALNLEDVQPTLFIPANFSFPGSDPNNEGTDPMLVSILMCDPHFVLSPATVTATGSTLQAVVQRGSPIVKNIPVEAANAIFSQSLLDATSSVEAYGDTRSFVNAIARILFFPNRSFEYDDKPKGIKPLPLGEINKQMNMVLLSSAKAFLSGYAPNLDNLTVPSFEMIDTDAIGEVQQPALVGSKPFLIALGVVIGVLVVLLVTLVAVVRTDQLQPFDLENIVKTLRLH